MSAAAEALYRAIKDKATGWVTLTAQGRESQLLFDQGDLVGANIAFGHQSLAQSLLQDGKIQAAQLDALWARGEGGRVDGESLSELGADSGAASALQVLASVRGASMLASEAKFEKR